jgi:hypothetical protein
MVFRSPSRKMPTQYLHYTITASFLLLIRQIGLSGLFPFGINSGIMNLIDSRLDSSDR